MPWCWPHTGMHAAMGCLKGKGKKSLKGEKIRQRQNKEWKNREGRRTMVQKGRMAPTEKEGLKWRRESPLLGNGGALMGRRVPASQYLGALFANCHKNKPLDGCFSWYQMWIIYVSKGLTLTTVWVVWSWWARREWGRASTQLKEEGHPIVFNSKLRVKIKQKIIKSLEPFDETDPTPN